MDKKKFYGTDENKSLSYLEFGAIDLIQGKKIVWDFRIHQKAYDWLMLGRYSNDLISYLNMTEQMGKLKILKIISLYNNEIHHKNDASVNLGKLCALAVMNKEPNNLSFFELGQTIYGCIEGMEFYLKLLEEFNIKFPSINLKDIVWYGVDISDFFNKISILMHEKYNIKTTNDLNLLTKQTDVFFAKGVTLLYAVDTVEKLFEILNKANFCIFDYSFSMKGNTDTIIGSGKTIKYLNFENFYKEYKNYTKKMYVRKNKSSYNQSTNRIFIDCIYADENICQDFINLDIRVRNELTLKLASEPSSFILLDKTENEVFEWLKIEDFIDSIKN